MPLEASTKDEALKKLLDHFVKVHQIPNASGLVNDLSQRETIATTFLPNGLAVPHARSEYVDKIEIVMGISKKGISDSTVNDRTAKIFCMFFSPAKEDSFGEHLGFLTRISTIFNEKGLVEELSDMTSPDDVINRIKRREKDLEE